MRPSVPPNLERDRARAVSVRAFLRRKARELRVPLPPLGATPRTWWPAWRAPDRPPLDLPARPGPFLRRLIRHVRGPVLLATLVTTIAYLGTALLPWAMGRMLDVGLDRGLGPQLVRPVLEFLALAAVMSLANGLGQMTENGMWLNAAIGGARVVGHRVGRTGRAVKRRMTAGDVVTAMTTDTDYIGNAVSWIPELIGGFVSTVLVVVLMLRASVPLGLLIIVGLPIVIAGMSVLIRPLQAKQAVQREEQGKLTTISTDAVAGLRVLRGIGGEDVYNDRYRAQSDRVRRAGVRVAGNQAALNMLRSSLPQLFTAIVVGYGALLTFRGRISAGELVAFFGYTAFLRNPISTVTNAIQMWTRAWVGVKKLARVNGIAPEVGDSGPTSAPDPEAHGSAPDWPNAEFADARTGVVVRPRRITAIVCADPDVSAALAGRLARVDDRARVVAGGTDLRRVPVAAVRRAVYLSRAEPQLFRGTLRDELRGEHGEGAPETGVTELVYREALEDAAPDENALVRATREDGDDRLLHCLWVADAHDVVSSLRGGLDGELAEKGRNLSGGQRQRVALARALAADSPVLIAVEPTSAVDSHTEARIAQRLAAERAGRTTVLVTTSPLVLARCDEVIALDDDGREIARGTHAELRRAAGEGDPGARAYRAIVQREVEDRA